MEFKTHFNEDLASDSKYFKALESVMSCVEKNKNVAVDSQEKVCQNEFKRLRLAAFNNEVMYHNVNRKFF